MLLDMIHTQVQNKKVRIINTLFRYSEKNNHGQDNRNNKCSSCGRVDNGFARHMNIITNALKV